MIRRCFAPLMLAMFFVGASGSVIAQSVRIDSPWARPTPPSAKVGGAFMIVAGGKEADRIVSASSPAAAVVELHTHIMEGGVAKMRAIPVIEVPAHGKVELKPGGLHIMLINLKAPLKVGGTVPIKLRFEKAGEVDVNVAVTAKAPDASGGADGHAPAMHHKH